MPHPSESISVCFFIVGGAQAAQADGDKTMPTSDSLVHYMRVYSPKRTLGFWPLGIPIFLYLPFQDSVPVLLCALVPCFLPASSKRKGKEECLTLCKCQGHNG